MPDEPREAHLDLMRQGESEWQRVASEKVQYPGWSAHFRVENWANTQDVRYRLRLGDQSSFEGRIRKDPIDKETIVVGQANIWGENPVVGSPLQWTGEYEDGLGNKIRMLAYANPEDRKDETKRADGYGIVRFHKPDRTITFECWPRFARVDDGDSAQFPGWPVAITMHQNDGRKVAGYLPELHFENVQSPVVQVMEDASGEVQARGWNCRCTFFKRECSTWV